MNLIYAQDASWWKTEVPLNRSIGEITSLLLDKYKCETQGIGKLTATFQIVERSHPSAVESTREEERQGIRVFFVLDGHQFQMDFWPLAVDKRRIQGWHPTALAASKAAQTAANFDRYALDQMGRRALNWIKVVVQASLEGNDEVLMPYALQGRETLQQRGLDGFLGALDCGFLTKALSAGRGER